MCSASARFSAFSAASIFAFTEPTTAGFFTHVFLYLSIFLLCAGLATTLGIVIRQRLVKRGLYVQNLFESLRQGILFGILITGSVLLSALGLLVWWVELTFCLLIIATELFFYTS